MVADWYSSRARGQVAVGQRSDQPRLYGLRQALVGELAHDLEPGGGGVDGGLRRPGEQGDDHDVEPLEHRLDRGRHRPGPVWRHRSRAVPGR